MLLFCWFYKETSLKLRRKITCEKNAISLTYKYIVELSLLNNVLQDTILSANTFSKYSIFCNIRGEPSIRIRERSKIMEVSSSLANFTLRKVFLCVAGFVQARQTIYLRIRFLISATGGLYFHVSGSLFIA